MNFKCFKAIFLLLFVLSAHVWASGTAPSSVDMQGIPISGTVTDADGEAMTGVSVFVRGATIGTTTDANGRYSITVPEPGSVLVFTFVGFNTVDVAVDDQRVIDVTLLETSTVFDELVVVGYGTRQRVRVTGAIDQVGSETFENRPVTNAMQALQGSSPNLIIQQRNMNPNDNTMNINIRGIGTMSNNDPLVVVDGMISTGLDALTSNLNPNDIESITILKDAGSAAIYGSRSANGVILITTKSGQRNSRPRISFNGMWGLQVPEYLYRPVAGWENAILRNQASVNSGGTPVFTPEQLRDMYDNRNSEKWFGDQIFQNALQQSYDLSIAGGSDNTTFRVSLGHRRQESNFIGDIFLERYNFRTNLTTEWGRFRVASNIAYGRTLERTIAGGTGNAIIDVIRVPQYYYYQLKTDDGKYLLNDIITEQNPLSHLEQGGWENKADDNIVANLNLSFRIIDGLTARAVAGFDQTQHHRFRRWLQVPQYTLSDLERPARYINSNRDVDDYNEKRNTLNTQIMLDFNRNIAGVHSVDALIGVSNESFNRDRNMVRWRFTDPDLGYQVYVDSNPALSAMQPTARDNNYTSINEWRLRRSITSVFGRAGYVYDNKYFLDFSFRYDGSSRFHEDYRWGFFPSFSVAYMISEESFLESYKNSIGDLKIRSSWGILGNQAVDDYQFLTRYTPFANRFGFNNVAVAGVNFADGNDELSWEKSANFNIGFDATFLRNRNLNISFDWFNRRTYDMLLAPQIPSTFGATSGSVPMQNLGEMENKGWELVVGYRIRKGDLTHRISFNLADQQNKVTDFGGVERIHQGEEMFQLIREGEALNAFYGYRTDGLYQSYEEIENSSRFPGRNLQPGDVRYVETKENKNGEITPQDRVVLGYGFPRFTFGLTYNVSWKGFDASVLVQGVGKRTQMIRGEAVEPFHHGYWVSTMYQHQMDFWTPTNTGAKYPRLAPEGQSRTNNWQTTGSENYLFNMAYLRVKNIRVGYTLPRDISRTVGIERARISLTGQNLLTLSHNSFVDPEATNFGNNMGGRGGAGGFSIRGLFPMLKYYGINLDIEF